MENLLLNIFLFDIDLSSVIEGVVKVVKEKTVEEIWK